MITRVLSSVVVVAAIAACTSGSAPPAGGAAVFAQAQAGLNKRVAAVHDYVLEGTAKDLGAHVEKKFTLAFSQPQFLRATLGEEQTLVFDGNALVLLDHTTKRAQRLDKSAGEEQLLLALYQAFADITVEGWKPPLLRPKATSGAVTAGPDGERWTLTTPIDDATLKEEQVVLRTADASFVEKKTLDRAGNAVAFTKVLEDLTDPATQMRFPKRWEKQGATGHFEIALSKATVNAGVAPESFQTTLPSGYQMATQGTP
jgi:outer membrane lipoprotein-sorting protein